MVDMRPRMSRQQTANSIIPRMRVWPSSESNRLLIVHPTGIRFRDTVNDSVEWPVDTFTKRRLREGDVLDRAPEVVAPVEEETPVEAPIEMTATPAEEGTPAEETPTEEVPTEETPVEEIAPEAESDDKTPSRSRRKAAREPSVSDDLMPKPETA